MHAALSASEFLRPTPVSSLGVPALQVCSELCSEPWLAAGRQWVGYVVWEDRGCGPVGCPRRWQLRLEMIFALVLAQKPCFWSGTEPVLQFLLQNRFWGLNSSPGPKTVIKQFRSQNQFWPQVLDLGKLPETPATPKLKFWSQNPWNTRPPVVTVMVRDQYWPSCLLLSAR